MAAISGELIAQLIEELEPTAQQLIIAIINHFRSKSGETPIPSTVTTVMNAPNNPTVIRALPPVPQR